MQWTTELPSSTGPIKLQNQNVVGAPDGSVYIAATINDGEMDRLRFAKHSSTGAVQWVRYVTGLSIAARNPVLVHADASATVAVNANGKLCVVNFLASGSERSRNCFAEPFRAAIARAADDDVFVSSDRGQTVRKVGTDGSVRWARSESAFSNDLHSYGVDSDGNYFEVRNGRLKRWGAAEGSKLSDVATELPFYADDKTWNQRSLTRANGELVLTRYVSDDGAGGLNTTVRFAGNDDLLAATPVTVMTTITSGSVVRGTGYPSGVTTICSTAPGTTCALDSQYPYDWRCAGPADATGEIFFIPGTAGGYYNYPGTPIRYRSLTGVLSAPRLIVGFQFYGCKPDVDGDGAVMAMTDGIVALRRMLGMTGDPLTLGATHSCVPPAGRTYAGSFPLTGYDLDGDGQTLAATDGVLLLRFMLGLRGTALVAGAVGAGATRTTPAAILSFIGSECGLYTY